MKLIAGLGNPTTQYAQTRHNAGFFVIDTLAHRLDAAWSVKPKFKAETAETTWQGQKVILVKPTTYYNLSGEAIAATAHFYKISRQHIIVLHDELALPFGTLRLRHQGSDAGNNGMKSIAAHLGEDIARVRIGIAPETHRGDAATFVLGRFSSTERAALPAIADGAIGLVQQWLNTEGSLPATSLKISA